VLVNPAVTFTTSNAAVAGVSTSGVITAVGPGAATITATSGTVSQTFNLTVTGHPAGTSISNTVQLVGGLSGSVAFTRDRMMVAIGSSQILVLDAAATSVTSTITLTTQAHLVVAPRRTSGPAIAISVGTTSRLWFIDPASSGTAAVLDSLDIGDFVISAEMSADGTRAFMMLSNGQLAVIDVAGRREMPRVALGGGVTRLRLAPGDSVLYAITNVGVIFDMTDFALSRDGTLFYLLDEPKNLVRLVSIANGTVQQSVGVSANATTVALSPDDKQIWVTHSTPAQVTIYTGSATTGFLSSGQFATQSAPTRVYFNLTGSFAAVTNNGGWVDIVR
jgi:hypothetical protein